MLTGILILIMGVALQFWLGSRTFRRRNSSGLQEFSSYSKAVGTQLAERIVLIVSRLLVVLGLVWLGSAWFIRGM